MAIYHCSVTPFSRSAGQSAISAIAYRTGKKIFDERLGLYSDYTKRHGVVHTEIIAPDKSPMWAFSTSTLWNQVEKSETRKNSTVAREFEISLPHELNENQRLDLARNISQNLVDRFGFVVEFSIHKPDSEESKNHHVHILASTRKLTPAGFTEKTRELDEMIKSQAIVEVREMVSKTINKHLENANIKARVDHRSLMDQQKEAIKNKDYEKAIELSREPTIHIGKNPMFIEQNKKHNEKVKLTFKQFLQDTAKQLNQIKVDLTKQLQPKKPSQITKPNILQGLGDVFASGISWLIDTDHFGIEKRSQNQFSSEKEKRFNVPLEPIKPKLETDPPARVEIKSSRQKQREREKAEEKIKNDHLQNMKKSEELEKQIKDKFGNLPKNHYPDQFDEPTQSTKNTRRL